MPIVFKDFDISDFFESSQYASESYIDSPPTQDEIDSVERTLGYSLPKSYIELARYQNGGIPRKTKYRTEYPTSWAQDHIAITGIYSIGHRKLYSLCGEFDSQFWIDEWGYPAIGIYFADCPSAGHDMLCLDYRDCGKNGEPQVVHVDQEYDYKITFVAKNFESFIRGLENDEIDGE
jgi:SMI1-KNR4 cell-wall